MTSPALAILTGWATDLAAADLGVWDPGSTYADDVRGITIAARPESPAQLIVLTPYTAVDDPHLAVSMQPHQVWLRGDEDPFTVIDLEAAIFDLMQGRTLLTYSAGDAAAVQIADQYRVSSTPLTQDENGRWCKASSWYVEFAWQTAHRLD